MKPQYAFKSEYETRGVAPADGSAHAGFTLLEMLLVLAIVCILAAQVIPQYQGFMVRRQIDVVARELAQGMQTARVFAQAHAINVRFCPVGKNELNAAAPKCRATTSNEDWAGWVFLSNLDGQVLLRSKPLPPAIQVCGNADNGRVINERGGSDFSGFTLYVKASKMANLPAQEVTFAPSGRVQVATVVVTSC